MTRYKPFFVILTILSVVILVGCDNLTGQSVLQYRSAENLILALEGSLQKKDFSSLASLFSDKDYAFVLRDLYFDAESNITIHYGFPRDEELKKPIITTKDMDITIPGRIKYLDKKSAISAIYIDSKNKKLFSGIVLQKKDGHWKITRMYDFVVVDSIMLDVKNFNLDFFTNNFELKLMISDNIRKKGLQTSYLYNIFLDLEDIDVSFHNRTLCSFSQEDIQMKTRDRVIEPEKDKLFMVDEMIISGECDYSPIVSRDLEEKYFLEIRIQLASGDVIKAYYYGDLRL